MGTKRLLYIPKETLTLMRKLRMIISFPLKMKRFLVYVEHQAVEEHSTNASDTFVFFKMRKHQGAWTVPDTNTIGVSMECNGGIRMTHNFVRSRKVKCSVKGYGKYLNDISGDKEHQCMLESIVWNWGEEKICLCWTRRNAIGSSSVTYWICAGTSCYIVVTVKGV